MIKTLSPYYVEIPLVSPLSGATCTSFTLEIFIWDGLKDSPPVDPAYSITKSNPELSTGNAKINIARLINDFIEFEPQTIFTGLIDGNNQRWVKVQNTYETDDIEDKGEPQNISVDLALKGYGYGMGGENQPLPLNKILIPINEYKVNRTGYFSFPFLIDETIL